MSVAASLTGRGGYEHEKSRHVFTLKLPLRGVSTKLLPAFYQQPLTYFPEKSTRNMLRKNAFVSNHAAIASTTCARTRRGGTLPSCQAISRARRSAGCAQCSAHCPCATGSRRKLSAADPRSVACHPRCRGRTRKWWTSTQHLKALFETTDYRMILSAFRNRHAMEAPQAVPSMPAIDGVEVVGVYRSRRDPRFRDPWSSLIRAGKLGELSALRFLAAMLAAHWHDHDPESKGPDRRSSLPCRTRPAAVAVKGAQVTTYLAERFAMAAGLPVRRRTLRRLSGAALG